MDDNHLEIWLWEDTEESHWERWAGQVERLLGHDLDGSFREDGYSLDHAWDMYREGLTPEQARARVEHDKKFASPEG